jgi:hypothetical protein
MAQRDPGLRRGSGGVGLGLLLRRRVGARGGRVGDFEIVVAGAQLLREQLGRLRGGALGDAAERRVGQDDRHRPGLARSQRTQGGGKREQAREQGSGGATGRRVLHG